MSQSLNNQERHIISVTNPKSPISEAYRTLRTNISFSAVDEDLDIIMVTSAGPGEGKSTTVANLAATFAQSDKRTLLIELDLRKPTVHKTFKLSNRLGMSHVLTKQATLDEVIQDTAIPNLSAITAGMIPPNPSELLGSKALGIILKQLKEQFEQIIIDTPPVLALTDAQLISTHCDGVVLVAESGKVKRSALLDAKERLQIVKARIIGVVINNAKRKAKDNYYYYYYGQEDK
ncbi:capsular polysaccharide biosynthesis protein [Paenibacillus montaniterrae]|uniref:non-specific protein-tyrosine kinase n=1 Tax=Paenibacillus montaniterrae TaxID=429341 RepID=A0A919YNJ4_9BACL|nr:CpsD/CapB family tyrosine-protein kinase [Paenibacillus montaniterrae]GIP16495.1 capsular polysaccharide biosynthesis protein [Paenibacillus montaniterrae]